MNIIFNQLPRTSLWSVGARSFAFSGDTHLQFAVTVEKAIVQNVRRLVTIDLAGDDTYTLTLVREGRGLRCATERETRGIYAEQLGIALEHLCRPLNVA